MTRRGRCPPTTPGCLTGAMRRSAARGRRSVWESLPNTPDLHWPAHVLVSRCVLLSGWCVEVHAQAEAIAADPNSMETACPVHRISVRCRRPARWSRQHPTAASSGEVGAGGLGPDLVENVTRPVRVAVPECGRRGQVDNGSDECCVVDFAGGTPIDENAQVRSPMFSATVWASCSVSVHR